MNSTTMARLLISGALLCLLSVATLAQSSLPKEVQAEILKQQIVSAVEAEDHTQTLILIDEYKRLMGMKTPTPLYFAEASAAEATGDFVRALAALEDYLGQAKKDSPNYSEAVQRYPRVREAANKQSGGLVDLMAEMAGPWEVVATGCGSTRGVKVQVFVDEQGYNGRTYQYGGAASFRLYVLLLDRGYRADACPMSLEWDPESPAYMRLHVADERASQSNYSWCRTGRSVTLQRDGEELKLRGDFFSEEPFTDVCVVGGNTYELRHRKPAR